MSERTEFRDTLPQALVLGVPVELHYQVRVTNAHGHAAGWSKPAVVVGGPAPEAVEGLHSELGANGLLIRWTPSSAPFDEVRIERIDPEHPQEKKKGLQQEKQARQQVLLTVPARQGDPGGAIDATAEAGKRYIYRLERRRHLKLGSNESILAGAMAELDTGVLRDTTPPSAPAGVEALAEDSGIALSWQPGTEPDLAGYVVYRSESGGEVRLTAAAIVAPQYTDATALKGHRYRYRIAAVDRAGNESVKSSPVTEEMR